MADTVGSVAQEVLRLLRVYGPSETVRSADLEEMRLILNSMLDMWSIENLACFAILEQSVQLQVGLARYSIGPGGVINSTRPVRLIEGPGAAYLQDSNQNNYPVDVYTKAQWNQISLKTITSNIPNVLYYDPQFPLGYINVFPVPNAGDVTLYFDSFQQLGSLPNLNSALTFPPGYKEAIKNNWALHAKPYFKSGEVDPIIATNARQGKRLLKRSNRRTPQAIFDAYIVSQAYPTYNVYDDNQGV